MPILLKKNALKDSAMGPWYKRFTIGHILMKWFSVSDGTKLPGRIPELSLTDTGLFSVENAGFSEKEEGTEEPSHLFYPCVWWVRAKLFGGNSAAFLVRYSFLKCWAGNFIAFTWGS